MDISFLLPDGMRPKALIENEKKETPLELNLEEITTKSLQKQAVIMLLNTLLGQGLSSRLWAKTVEEEMLFYKIESQIVRFKQTGFLQISGQISNSQFSFGLESVLSSLEAFKKTTVSINELIKAKEYLQSRLIMEQEDLFNSTFWKVENYLGSGLNYELDDLLKAIENIETAQIRSLALDLFDSKNLVITTLGTAKETRLVEKLIKKYLG
jgi:predicted Zn-dependent peptidase